jgi:hypothetical protein
LLGNHGQYVTKH